MKKQIVVVENGVKFTKEMTIEECIKNFGGAVRRWSNNCYMDMKDISRNLMDYDDFYSEGMIVLIEVYNKYKPINTFNTLLHKSLDNLKVNLIRQMKAKRRTTEQNIVSFHMELEENEEDCDLLQDIEGDIDRNYEKVEIEQDIKDTMSKLNYEEKKILEFLIENESTKIALAKELNITRPTLDTRIEMLKRKVIRMLPEYLSNKEWYYAM